MIIRIYLISLPDCYIAYTYVYRNPIHEFHPLNNIFHLIKTEGNTHLSNISLEECIQSKQFNYLIQI